MKAVAVALSVAAAMLALPSQASETLAKKHNCLACHASDKKLVGPSYKEVAAKYGKDPAAQQKLADKVKKGGQGVWGQVPMPPNPQVPDGEVQALVKWILTQK